MASGTPLKQVKIVNAGELPFAAKIKVKKGQTPQEAMKEYRQKQKQEKKKKKKEEEAS